MHRDDCFAAVEAAINPAREMMSQMHGLNAGSLANRLAESALEARNLVPAMLDHFDALEGGRHILAASEAFNSGAHAREILEWSSGLPAISTAFEGAVKQMRESADYSPALRFAPEWSDAAQLRVAALTDDHRVMRDLERQFGAVLRGYPAVLDFQRVCNGMTASLAAHDLRSMQRVFGSDALAALESDFDRVKEAATALAPLEQLGESLLNSVRGSSAIEELQRFVNPMAMNSADAGWLPAYSSLAELTARAMGQLLDLRTYGTAEESKPFNRSPSPDDVESQSDVNADPIDEAADVEVWRVALAFVLSAVELQARLARLASRFDFTTNGLTSLDRMFLAVAAECPQYAAGLARLAYPLLQRLAWHNAPAGNLVGDASECLAMEDAEEFALLVHAVVRLLDEIEQSLST